jgi:hypothetical protein
MSEPARRSTVNASELSPIFTDYDTRERPYDGRALKVSLVGDVLFVYIGKLTENAGSEVFQWDDSQSIGVDAEALYEALGSMLRRADRENHERAREGTLPADHPSLVAVPATAAIPATRRRA